MRQHVCGGCLPRLCLAGPGPLIPEKNKQFAQTDYTPRLYSVARAAEIAERPCGAETDLCLGGVEHNHPGTLFGHAPKTL